jgi:hypothetical protein
LDFGGDLSIAGGGVWPEPYQFDPTQERASFFWGRDASGTFRFYDDYNLSEQGYHQEAWYVIADHTPPEACAWSDSYTDPFSREPMITCTVGIFRGARLQGVATVDLQLGGIKR